MAVGVPVMVKFAPEVVPVRPGGSVPVTVNVYGAEPFVAVKVREYAAPTAPAGRAVEPGDRDSCGLLTRMLSCAVAEEAGLLESVTLAVKETVVALAGPVGVPVMAPVFEASDRPAGRAPAEMLQVSGAVPPLLASIEL